MPFLPNIPTLSEAGVSGYESIGWTGFLAPTKTPEIVIIIINQDVASTLLSQEMRTMLENSGAVVVASKPNEFSAFIKAEIAKWAKVIEISGARID